MNEQHLIQLINCAQCGKGFNRVKSPKGGRPQIFCSADCAALNRGQKLISITGASCAVCKSIFFPKRQRGAAPCYCSDKCRQAINKQRAQSEKHKSAHIEYSRRWYQKSKLAKILNAPTKKCAECETLHNRTNSKYCSKNCRIQFKVNQYKKRLLDPDFKMLQNEKKNARRKNPDARAQQNEYQRKRNALKRATDPIFVMKERIRCRTKAAFLGQGFAKGCKTREMLGCSWEQFKTHIESQFQKDMKWGNRDLWHIDHIIPLASAKTIDDLEKLAHFSNLRPMWAKENIKKSAKIITCQPELPIKL
jgi:hypothetical protein